MSLPLQENGPRVANSPRVGGRPSLGTEGDQVR